MTSSTQDANIFISKTKKTQNNRHLANALSQWILQAVLETPVGGAKKQPKQLAHLTLVTSSTSSAGEVSILHGTLADKTHTIAAELEPRALGWRAVGESHRTMLRLEDFSVVRPADFAPFIRVRAASRQGIGKFELPNLVPVTDALRAADATSQLLATHHSRTADAAFDTVTLADAFVPREQQRVLEELSDWPRPPHSSVSGCSEAFSQSQRWPALSQVEVVVPLIQPSSVPRPLLQPQTQEPLPPPFAPSDIGDGDDGDDDDDDDSEMETAMDGGNATTTRMQDESDVDADQDDLRLRTLVTAPNAVAAPMPPPPAVINAIVSVPPEEVVSEDEDEPPQLLEHPRPPRLLLPSGTNDSGAINKLYWIHPSLRSRLLLPPGPQQL